MPNQSHKKRILILHCSYRIKSGEGVIVHNEVKLLRENGFDVKLEMVDNDAHFLQTFLNLILAPFNFISFFKIFKLIKTYQPQVVHIHNWHFSFSPSIFIAAKLCKVKVVHSIHNYRLLCPSGTLFHKDSLFLNSINKSFPFLAIRKRVYRNSFILTFWLSFTTRLHHILGTWKNIDTIVVNSAFAKQMFVNSYLSLQPEKVVVKKNFNFSSDIKIQLNRQDYYLFVGRISEEKGILLLLDVAATLGIKLRIIGDGDEAIMKTVRNYAAENSNIIYLGRQQRNLILEEMASCKALIFPSNWFEGMPITIIEAFQVGTPVIASNIGVMKEMIVHNENGLLFKAKSKAALTSAICDWEELSFLAREKFYINARNTFLQNYTSTINFNALVNVYGFNAEETKENIKTESIIYKI